MKHISNLLFCSSALFAQGQNCTTTELGLNPLIAGWWADADLAENGDIVGAIIDEPGLTDLFVVKTAVDGQLIWQTYVAPTNPEVRLLPKQAVAMPDGGLAVLGYTMMGPTMYEHNFVARLRADGTMQWARYYMKNNSSSFDWTRTSKLVALPTGELLLALARSNGISAIRLDAEGLPVWHRRYAPSSTGSYGTVTGLDASVEENGIMTLMGTGTQSELWLCRVGTDGSILWSKQYQGLSANYGHVLSLSDGGVVVYSIQGIHRFDPDGTWLWGWQTNVGQDVVELMNGDLLVHGDNTMKLDPDGMLLEAWATTYGYEGSRIISARGDSIRLAQGFQGTGGEPMVTLLPSLADLDCMGNNYTPIMNAHPGATSVTDSGFVHLDSVKTWTMSYGEPVEFGQLDVSLGFASTGPRPGLGMMYYAGYENLGGLPSGPVTATLTFDPMLIFGSGYPPPASVTENTVTWELPALESFHQSDYAALWATFHVPAEAEMGYMVNATMQLTQDSTEFGLANNLITLDQPVSNSYDPNDKLVFPRDNYHIVNDSILDYTIRFQNTGTAEAYTVVIVDTLPLDVDVTTFRMGTASHACTYTLTGNGLLTFTFDNILLPDSNTNEPLSHGLVNFRIKPILPLQLGQEITNAADIYFDFNEPIRTPDATVVVTDETGVQPLVKPAQLVVYPVPVKNNLTAVVPEGFKPVHAFAVGVDGRRLPLVLPPSSAGQVQFATQHLPAGAYVLTLRAQDGRRLSARFVKE